MGLSESEKWSAVLDGDDKAWRQLVRRYQSLVYTVALRAGLSMAEASDCFQQTWLALFKNRHRLKDPSRLSAWLVTTSKREALRLVRRTHPSADSEDVPEQVDTAALQDEQLEQLERQTYFKTALDQMDSRCRKLLHLLFLGDEDLSYEQIAVRSGISFNSLGPIRRRCLEKLRKVLEDLGYPIVRN